MFCCGNRDCEPPLISKIIDGGRIRSLLKKEFDLVDKDINISSDNFGLYARDELDSFLRSRSVSSLKRSGSRFGENGYIESLVAKEKMWYSKSKRSCKSAFGVVFGDIYFDDNHVTSVNCFIDSQENIWLIEPLTLDLFQIDKRSNVTCVKI